VSAYSYPAAGPYPAAPSASLSDPTSVMGRRSVAWIVDLLLYLLLMSFFSPTPLSPFAKYEEVPEGFDDPCSVIEEDNDVYQCIQIGDRVYYTEAAASAVGFAVALAWFFGVYGVLQGVKGVTPGKALLGVRVVDEQGRTPGIGKALGRSVLWIVDGIPYCFPLVAVITGFSTKGHRRVGDMAAKTFVVGKDDAGRPVVIAGLTTAYPGYGPPGYGPPGGPGQPPWGPPPGGPGGPGAQPPWGAPAPAPGPGAWGQPTPTPGAPAGSPYDQRPAPPSGGWAAPGADTGPTSPTPSGEQTPGAGPGATWAGPAAAGAAAAASGEPETSSAFAPPRIDETRPDAPAGEASTATPLGPASTPSTSGDEPPATPLGPASTASPAETSATGPTDDEPSATPLGPATTGEPTATPAGPSPTGPRDDEPTATPLGPATTGEPTATPAGPATGDQTTPSPQPAAQQASTGYEPQWDAARNTYIVWEPNRRQWLGWDDAAKQWRPL
jgi:Na+-translocating ferredoxin:NAD+ oxidoreductase RnfG subunit